MSRPRFKLITLFHVLSLFAAFFAIGHYFGVLVSVIAAACVAVVVVPVLALRYPRWGVSLLVALVVTGIGVLAGQTSGEFARKSFCPQTLEYRLESHFRLFGLQVTPTSTEFEPCWLKDIKSRSLANRDLEASNVDDKKWVLVWECFRRGPPGKGPIWRLHNQVLTPRKASRWKSWSEDYGADAAEVWRTFVEHIRNCQFDQAEDYLVEKKGSELFYK